MTIQTIGQFLSYLLPVFYLMVLYMYYAIYSGKQKNWAQKTTRVLILLLFIHGTEIVIRNIALDTMPLSTAHDALSFLAFSLLFVYLIIEMGMSERGSGMFIVFFAFFLQLVSLRYLSWEPETNDLLTNPSFAIHASISIMGYTALTISAIYSLLYLIQKKNLKKRNLGKLFNQLPALNYLEKLSVRATLVGIVLMGIGIIFGHRQAYTTIGSYWPNDPKVILSDTIWLTYVIGFVVARNMKWSGNRIAYFSLAIFLVLITSGAIVVLLSDSFHKFY
jgi:HemX protein